MAILTQREYDSIDELGADEIFVLRQFSLGFGQSAIDKQLQNKKDRDSKATLDQVLGAILTKLEVGPLPSPEKRLYVATKRYVDYSDMNRESIKPNGNGVTVSAGPARTANGAGSSSSLAVVPQRLGLTSVWSSLPAGEWQAVLTRVGKAIAEGKYVTVDPFKVRPMKGQPRDYFPAEEQGSLGESMDLTGQIQDTIIRNVPHVDASHMSPLRIGDRVWKVEETEYEICDGERRWRSVLEKRMNLRAKLIDIDDEGAYFVSSVANFNRVGHTAVEEAKNLKRLLEGKVKFPFEVAIALQGISKSKARRLLDVLNLPTDLQAMMNPGLQKAKGEEVLGKAFSYQIARLGSNPVLHEHARSLARRAVNGEMKLPQVSLEVDRILSQSGTGRNVLGHRNEPARRLSAVEAKVGVVVDTLRDIRIRLSELKKEGALPEAAATLRPDLNNIADMAEEALAMIGGTRIKNTPN